MDISTMNTPNTRKEFEYRMSLLEVAIREGKMMFASQCMGSVDSLQKVRKMGNGRLDLLTVDEAARLQANMMTNMMNMESSLFNSENKSK